MLKFFDYYRFSKRPLAFSKLIRLKTRDQEAVFSQLEEKQVEIVSFCIMPTHFHLLLLQLKKEGVSKFMSDIQNAYTRYFNTRFNRKGPLYETRFKSVEVGSEEQLLHVSRYIHLNPYSASLVKTRKELQNYPWSSLPEYFNQEEGICKKDLILSQFSSIKKYREFVFDQADYQRSLQRLKPFLATPGVAKGPIN